MIEEIATKSSIVREALYSYLTAATIWASLMEIAGSDAFIASTVGPIRRLAESAGKWRRGTEGIDIH